MGNFHSRCAALLLQLGVVVDIIAAVAVAVVAINVAVIVAALCCGGHCRCF